jgi:hypothetical protein
MTHLIIFHYAWMEFIAQITWKHMPINYVVKVEKGGSLKGKSNGTRCIEANFGVDDKEWNIIFIYLSKWSIVPLKQKRLPFFYVYEDFFFNCTKIGKSNTCQTPRHLKPCIEV